MEDDAETSPSSLSWTEVEDAMADVAPPAETTEAPPVAPAATVIGHLPMVHGIEAREDESAKGDVTEALAGVLQACGAGQAYHLGRVILPTGGTAPVPVVAKVVVQNSGGTAWPESTVVVAVNGDPMGLPAMPLGAIAPSEPAVVNMDLLVPPRQEPGSSKTAWTILDAATGQPLGPLMIFEAVWSGA